MRKNLAKHTAKKLPLAKRVLALCFALIFVCSCLLPAFANGTGVELDTPDTEVVEAADPGTEPEPMDLYDEPAALDDDFAVADGLVLKHFIPVKSCIERFKSPVRMFIMQCLYVRSV